MQRAANRNWPHVETAIFGINGPTSVVPPNVGFFRPAPAEFYM
jgi:hypothetical protein